MGDGIMKPSNKVTNKFDTQLTAYCDDSYNDAIYEYDTWIDECDIEGVIDSYIDNDETSVEVAKAIRDLIKGESNE